MVIQVEDKSADNGLISKELNNIQNAEPAPARVATTMSEFEVAELKALRNRFGDDFEVSRHLITTVGLTSFTLIDVVGDVARYQTQQMAENGGSAMQAI